MTHTPLGTLVARHGRQGRLEGGAWSSLMHVTNSGRRPDLGRPDLGRPDLGRPDLGSPDLGRPDPTEQVTDAYIFDERRHVGGVMFAHHRLSGLFQVGGLMEMFTTAKCKR